VTLPPLLKLSNEAAYREHFRKHYLTGTPLVTFDGIRVRFFAHNFDHAFFTESVRDSGIKDTFDWSRAERMDWVGAVLRSSAVELYRRVMPKGKVRRIALIPAERYTVVIGVEKSLRLANFVTAYVVNSDSALNKMMSNPKWYK
jgi:hypothetical protein